MEKFDVEKWKAEVKQKLIDEVKNNPNAIAGFVGGECVAKKAEVKLTKRDRQEQRAEWKAEERYEREAERRAIRRER